MAEHTSEGLRTRKGGPWTSQQIRRTIEHPYDAGYVVMNGERRDGDHEPLIERGRWEAIQALLSRRDPVAVQARRGGRSGAAEFVLRGLAICPICEAPLHCQTIDGKRRYRRAGDTDLADQAMRELGRIEAEADELRERIAAAEARLGEWTAEPDLDAALDFYNRLVDHARGRIADAATAVELNAALSSVLAGAWLALDDHDQLHATFRLRPGSEPLERRRPA